MKEFYWFIGDSNLGPKLASESLKPYWSRQVKCNYLIGIGGSDLTEVLWDLNREATQFIVQSKSFNTQEALKNASACREWFLHNGGTEKDLARHFSAVTASVAKQ